MNPARLKMVKGNVRICNKCSSQPEQSCPRGEADCKRLIDICLLPGRTLSDREQPGLTIERAVNQLDIQRPSGAAYLNSTVYFTNT